MMKATSYFNTEMSSGEARLEFAKRFLECETVQEIEELEAAYKAITIVIIRRETEDALVNGIMC